MIGGQADVNEVVPSRGDITSKECLDPQTYTTSDVESSEEDAVAGAVISSHQ